MNRREVTKQEVSDIKVGTIIKYDTFDNDDFVIWHFKAIRVEDGFIYLGGGIDFGSAIGNKKTVDEVVDEINCNDFPKFEIIAVEK